MTTALLSSTYFGPIQWYQKLNSFDCCRIERHDSFIKQTYRNRCVIATANGQQALTVPIIHDSDDTQQPLQMKDVRISNHGNWRHLHRNALLSAYGESPFFEYYADDILPFFEKRLEFLFDFNLEITHKLCELLDIQPRITLTDHYEKEADNDFREAIRPKRPLPDPMFEAQPYYQVYQQKTGFQPNLSVLDLLFNMGNESIFYLLPKANHLPK